MSAITIRNIEPELKLALRKRAASNERSMEEEVRVILRHAVRPASTNVSGLGTEIRSLVEEHGGGADLEMPPRGPDRTLPDVFEP